MCVKDERKMSFVLFSTYTMSFYSLSMFVYIDFAYYKNAEINIICVFKKIVILGMRA